MRKYLFIFIFLLSSNLKAQNFDDTKYISRDWGGVRSELYEKGVDPFVGYVSIASSNISGGVDRDVVFAGQLYAGVNLNLEKIINLKGTRFKVSMVNRHGEGLLSEVGSVFEPVTIVGGQATFLYDLNFEKDIGNFTLKAGRYAATDDFSFSTLYFYSLSTAINGPIRALLLDGLMSSFPFPVWGSRLQYKPNNVHQFRIGAYQIPEGMFDATLNGLDFSFRSSDNLSTFLQYDWTGMVNGNPARLYVGTHQAFGGFSNFDGETTTAYFSRYYAHFEANFIEDVTTFLLATYALKGDIARTPFQSSFGLNWEGIFASRPKDKTLFFATYANYSNEFNASREERISDEFLFEAGHRFHITNGLYIQPAIQYSIRPGGSGDVDNAIIPGVWLEAQF